MTRIYPVQSKEYNSFLDSIISIKDLLKITAKLSAY